MSENELLTTTQLASARGVTRQAVIAAVKRGALTPSITLDNGYFLFACASNEAPVEPESAS